MAKRKRSKKAPAKVVKVKTKAAVVQGPETAEAVKLATAAAEREKHAAEERARVAAATRARLDELGLREYPIEGSPLSLLCLKDSSAIPTMEQRLCIARRVVEVGPSLPKYIPKGVLMKRSIPGVSTSEIEKAFAQNKRDEELRQKELAREAKKKAKEEEAKKKLVAAQTKRMKSVDVTPKVDKAKLAASVAAAAQKKPASKAVKSAPVAKAKAGKQTSYVPMKVPAGGFNKTNCPATSGELIRARIMEHKLTDAQIAAEVRKLFEGRKTSETDVRWNRGQMRLRDIKAPDPVDGPPQKARK